MSISSRIRPFHRKGLQDTTTPCCMGIDKSKVMSFFGSNGGWFGMVGIERLMMKGFWKD